MINWHGIFPALTTPFTADDTLDIELFSKNIQAQIDAGVHGIIIGGSLGEASTLTENEKEILVKTAIEIAANKIPVVLNIAESSTRDAVRQGILAKAWRVDGLMLLPPMRYRSDDRETVSYFKEVAKSTDLPIMIYNNPIDYKIEVTLDMFSGMQECTNITAIKESTRDVSNIARMRNRFGDRFKLFCGVDTIAMEELLLGADGWVAGLVNAFPVETVMIFELCREAKIEQATQMYRWFMPLLELDIHPKLVQYIKLAMARVGLGSEYVRAPRLVLEGEERRRILEIIDKGIAERPRINKNAKSKVSAHA